MPRDNGNWTPLNRDRAIELFTTLVGLGYAASIKHIRGNFYVEIPVRLRGDKAYGQEAEITRLANRAGYQVLQTGRTLRVA